MYLTEFKKEVIKIQVSKHLSVHKHAWKNNKIFKINTISSNKKCKEKISQSLKWNDIQLRIVLGQVFE